jgi:hypothetical protein
MSLDKELGSLAPKEISTALASVLGRVLNREDIQGLLGHLSDDYPVLCILPDAIVNVIEQLSPETEVDSQRLRDVRVGATILAVVISEYAHLGELNQLFPDLLPPEQ